MTQPESHLENPSMMTTMNNDLEKAKFYLEETHAFYNLVLETRRKLDEKILNMIVLSGVLINVVVGLAYFLVEQNATRTPNVIWLLFASVVSYFGIIVIGLISYRPRDIVARNIRKVIEKYEKGEQSSETVSPIQHVAWNLSRDAEKNFGITKEKGFRLQLMLFIFAIGLAFLVVALFYLAYGY